MYDTIEFLTPVCMYGCMDASRGLKRNTHVHRHRVMEGIQGGTAYL